MKNEIEWYLMYQTSGSPSAWSEWQIEKIGTKEECQLAEASLIDEMYAENESRFGVAQIGGIIDNNYVPNMDTVITQCPEDYNDYYRD